MKLATSAIFSLFIVGIYAASTTLSDSGLPPASSSFPADIPTVKPRPTKPNPTSTEPITEPSTTTETKPTEPKPTEPKPTDTPTPAPEPKTTSTEPVPTTPAPVPTTPRPVPGKPDIGKYVLSDANQTCILAEFAAQLNFSYSIEPNKTEYFVYNLPGTGNDTKSAKGSCGNGTTDQYIVIEWLLEGEVNTLNLTFHLNATTKEFSLTESVFNLSSNVIPNNNKTLVFYRVGSFFEIPKDRSYYCTRVQSLNLTDSATADNVVGTVSVSHVLLEAFHSAQNKQYSSSIDCDAINTPDIVPIAVGICLIALVVIVLIAYLVGRRRAAARGYVSM